MKDLEIVVPVKNEEKNVAELTRQIHNALSSKSISYNIIFVVDKSTDNTLRVIHRLSEEYPITLHEKVGKGGKGFSLLEGFSLATAKHVAFIDGDLQYPPSALPEMFELVNDDEVGVVVANRKTYKSNSLTRKLGSRINAFIFGRVLLNLNCDIQSGLKIFKRDIFQHIDRDLVTAWTFDIPLLNAAKDIGYTIKQHNIDFENRRSGSSHVGFIKTAAAISKCAIKTKFSKKHFYHIDDERSKTGHAIIYKKKRYITHTNLPYVKSAIYTLKGNQKVFLFIFLSLLLFVLIKNPLNTALVFVAFLSFVYFVDVFFNLYVLTRSLNQPPEVPTTEKEIKALDDKNLPVYTVMCPLFKEWEVLPQFVENVSKLDWPKDKLEVLLLLEEVDKRTIEVAQSIDLPSYIKIVIVPNSMPKTKPKACNYGLYEATGEYVVVYDAEDQPDTDQLKKAYLAFNKSKSDIFCVQGKLNYYNPHHNLLTKLFTAEYSLWFDIMLPGLQSIDTTIPLGGTSNHFRTEDLKNLHGWDPFNVTEDCDLGVRLFKEGYKTAIIDSTTLEEANSDLKNWIRQRSRWIKGYMQTYFVHMRDPIQFFKNKKWHALIFQLIIGMRIYFMLINPILWIATISYFVLYKYVGPTIEYLYPTAVFYMAGVSLVFGNFMYLYNYMIGCAKRNHWSLIKYIFLIPFYWVFMSVSAVLAFWQLLFKPHHWEKTNHGLHLKNYVAPSKETTTEAAEPVSTPEPVIISEPAIEPNPVLAPVYISGSVTQDEKIVFSDTFIQKVNSLYKFGLNYVKNNFSAFLLIVVGIFTNFLNYLYNAYLSRKLPLEDFGLISLVGSFLFLSSILLGALFRTVTNKTAFFFGKYKSSIHTFWSSTRKRALYIGVVISFIWVVLTPLLKTFFNSNTSLPFIIFTPIWFISAMASVDTGFLNGMLKFKVLALVYVVEAISKFLLTILLVELGFEKLVYISIPISIIFSFVVGYLFAKRIVNNPENVKVSEIKEFPLKFFFSSVLINFSSISFLTLDVLLAKHYLSPKDAGLYALISLTGKMIFFIQSLFGQFILPIVSKAEGSRADSDKTFNKLFLLSFSAGFAVYIVVGLFGWYFAPLLLGDKINEGVKYLSLYGLSILAFTISNSLVSFNQIKNKYLFAVINFILALVEIEAIRIFHSNIQVMITVIAIISLTTMIVTFMLHYFEGLFFIVSKNLNDLFSPLYALPKDFVIKNNLCHILIFNWRDTKHVWAGGAEVYIHELAKELIAKGYAVTVLCGNDRKNQRFEIIDGVQVIRIGGFYTVYLLAPLYYILKLHRHVDILIDSENGIPFFTPVFSSKPILGLIHHVHQEVILKELKLPFYKFPAAYTAKLLESILMPIIYRNKEMISVSESTKNEMINLGFGKNADINIINPGVDLSIFHTSEKTKNPTILYLGRLKSYKKIDTLINAMPIILDKYPEAKLNIAGFGDELPNLKKLTAQLKLEDSVNFLGKVDEETKIKLLGESWVFSYPSSMEGWGISIIEANACKTPVVASRVPGLCDSVKDNKSGFLVDLSDEKQFADKINLLFSDAKLRETMGEFAVKWAKQYTWKASSKKLSDLIQCVLANEVSSGYVINERIATEEK